VASLGGRDPHDGDVVRSSAHRFLAAAFFFGFGAAFEPPSTSSTLSTCPSTFTLGKTFMTFPSLMRNVLRIAPSTFLPYIVFSPHAPYASWTLRSGSERSGIWRPYLSRNLQ